MSDPTDTKPVLDQVAQVLREVDEEGADPVEAIGLIRDAVAKSAAGAPVNDGGPAFPWQNYCGVSARDFFAAHALPGLCLDHPNGPSIDDWDFGFIAEKAYEAADAMLAERESGGAS